MVLLDLRVLPNETIVDADVCVVGAGAAGISIALALTGTSRKVCLVEAGGLGGDQRTQALTRGENVGLPYFRLDEVRETGFGGTTSVWAGACRPLDAVDMRPREWVAYSGWPIERSELDQHYARAQEVCQLGPYAYETSEWDPDCRRRLPLPADEIQTDVFQISPTRFGQVHRRHILESPNVTTLLYANALDIELNDSGRLATGVRVATLHGKHGRVRARQVVLAMGGVENARLLLLSQGAARCGLGNEYDLVGRFFTEHPNVNAGQLLLKDPVRYSPFYRVARASCGGRSARIEAVLSLAERAARREGLLRCAAQFPTRWRTQAAFDSEAGQALAHMFRELRMRRVPYEWSERVQRVVRHFDQVLSLGYGSLTEPRGIRAVLPVRSISEQAPNPDSRVVLGSERDQLGRQMVKLDWRLGEQDYRSVQRFHHILGTAVRNAGVGELRSSLDADGDWHSRVMGGKHHMGTTRMSDSPSSGVVDANCRVHGTLNLYIAGSSVFPTVGYVNPTLTIVALALRLADHLLLKPI